MLPARRRGSCHPPDANHAAFVRRPSARRRFLGRDGRPGARLSEETALMTTTGVNTDARALAPELLQTLRGSLRGTLCLPGEPGYDQARAIWNAMIDRKPTLIVRAAGAADVMQAVDFARTHRLTLAIKGGGHNIAGNACCDGGLMIDLSPMKSVRIDPVAKTARVEPGVTLGEFDREAQAFGLATPVGINSTTGISG